MHKLKFHKYEFDTCVYHKREINGNVIYLLLYIDDILLENKDMSDVLHFKRLLKLEFGIKDLEIAKRP